MWSQTPSCINYSIISASSQEPSPPFPLCHPRLCISKKKEKKRLNATVPHLFKLQVGWFFKVFWNQCLQCCSFVVCAHRCNIGKRPCRLANTDDLAILMRRNLVFCLWRCLVSKSKMTHQLMKVHVPNIWVSSVQGWFTNGVFMFFPHFHPLPAISSSSFKELFNPCVYRQNREIDFWRFLSLEVFVFGQVGWKRL